MLWAIVACIIPDLPWVSLKVLLSFHLFDPFDLRLYSMVQASLAFCLLLSAALASFATESRYVFIILSGNCILHLLLDSLQIKWGNGVHLTAPFDWSMFHLDLTWPEHIATLLLTVFGGLFLLYYWKVLVQTSFDIKLLQGGKTCFSIALLVCYLLAPLIFLEDLEALNAYHIHTLREKAGRPGKPIELDRVHYFAKEQSLRTYSGEFINVHGPQPKRSGRVSFQGSFLTPDTIMVKTYHYHRDFRDAASYMGLFMACTLLIHSLIVSVSSRKKPQQGS